MKITAQSNNRSAINSSNNKIILLISVLLILYIVLFSNSSVDAIIETSIIKKASIYNLLIFVFIIFSSKKIAGSYVHPYIIYVTTTYLFNCGYFLLISLGEKITDVGILVYGWFNNNQIYQAIIFNTLCMLAFHVGMLISQNGRNQHKDNMTGQISAERLIRAGFLLTSLSLPFDIYYRVKMLLLSVRYGYGVFYKSTYIVDSSVLTSIGMFCIPGIFMIYVASKYFDNNRYGLISKVLFGYLLFRGAAYLISGYRGEGIATLLVVLWIFNYFRSKRRKIHIKISTIIILYFAIVLIPTTMEFRSIQGKTFEAFWEIFSNQFFSPSIFHDMITNLGGSVHPLLELIKKRDMWSLKYGLTYLCSVISVVPSFLRFGLYEVGVKYGIFGYADLPTKLSGLRYGLGYSIFAEAYYNLGNFGWMVIIVIGYVFAKCMFINDDSKNSIFKPVFVATFLFLIILSGRGTTFLLMKYIFYYCLVPYILTKMIK